MIPTVNWLSQSPSLFTQTRFFEFGRNGGLLGLTVLQYLDRDLLLVFILFFTKTLTVKLVKFVTLTSNRPPLKAAGVSNTLMWLCGIRFQQKSLNFNVSYCIKALLTYVELRPSFGFEFKTPALNGLVQFKEGTSLTFYLRQTIALFNNNNKNYRVYPGFG